MTVCLRKVNPFHVANSVNITAENSVIRPTNSESIEVLIAEDEPINQTIAREILESDGLTVDVANDGIEALKLASVKSHGVILMDVQMPDLDGSEAMCRIR